jgi:multidrug efflux pump subunit AcrA (membrane-fusion protein)
MPPSPVGYTEAREMQVRRDLKLTGSVAARQAGVVASQVAGLVVELAARDGDAVRRGQPLVKLRREQQRSLPDCHWLSACARSKAQTRPFLGS